MGCVLTNDDELAETVRCLIDHGGEWRQTRIHQRLGGNFRFNDILAAFGLSQIERLDRLRALRKGVFDSYRARIPGDGSWNGIGLDGDVPHPRCRSLAQSLFSRGIQAGQYYRPIHHNPPYHTDSSYFEAEVAYREWLYLPSSLSLRTEEIAEVCNAIDDVG